MFTTDLWWPILGSYFVCSCTTSLFLYSGHVRRPLLLVTLGYPGSGKTHFSERLAKKDGMVHLSSDEIRARMFEKPTFSIKEHKTVFDFRDFIAGELIEAGGSIICDSNFNFKRHRARMRGIAKRHGAQFAILWVRTHEATALKRVAKRVRFVSRGKKYLHRPLDEEVFNRLRDEIEHPTKSEPVIVVDGHKSFAIQYAQYKKQLRQIQRTKK